MIVGIPLQPLQFNAVSIMSTSLNMHSNSAKLDIALGKYRVKGSNNGSMYINSYTIRQQELINVTAPVNMRPAIEFSAKHNIKPHLKLYNLEDLPRMFDIMVSFSHTPYSARILTLSSMKTKL